MKARIYFDDHMAGMLEILPTGEVVSRPEPGYERNMADLADEARRDADGTEALIKRHAVPERRGNGFWTEIIEETSSPSSPEHQTGPSETASDQ
jgi:hypothetical protein